LLVTGNVELYRDRIDTRLKFESKDRNSNCGALVAAVSVTAQ
jgi:hypothetical protein